MLIIDNHNNYMFPKFDDYCKLNKIVTISILAHSFHLLQPLDVGLYSLLKLVYGR